jgi:ABC-type lipoprotein export system ATPase subunit
LSHTIELRKVSKYYANDETVSMGFNRVDLNLDIGEFVAITGESGSGKSTLLNVISGLDTYEEGEMFVCGEDTTAYSTEDYERYRKTYIGNIFQDFNLINSYTVYQNIELVMLISGKKSSECKARILELIDLVGLNKYRRTKVSKLSGGQKQRVAIARALAKDAPIIVADEPTGNLDSASAEIVMETLARVSRDKLVVVVTHNYDQAEPYVTRKITMHDGRIIEDKQVSYNRSRNSADADDPYGLGAGHAIYTSGSAGGAAEDSDQQTGTRMGRAARNHDAADVKAAPAAPAERTSRSIKAPKPGKMRKSSELRLGVRNTFNIPAKFILLFIVYFFVSTAVLGQYATTKNSLHQEELLGSNPYFTNSSSDRIIVKKNDESAFTDADFTAIENVPNIKNIVRNDLAIDTGVSFPIQDFYVDGSVYPVSMVDESQLTYGHMPESDYEIVVSTNTSSDAYFSISNLGEAMVGATVELEDMGQMQTYEFDKPITIAGVIIDNNIDDDEDYAMYGYSTVYVSDKVSNELMINMMASTSKSVLNFGGTKMTNDFDRGVYGSAKVPEGKVYIFEDDSYYYKDAKAEGKDFSVSISNRFFESSLDLKVDKIITSKNIHDLLGIKSENYDMFYSCVFISDKDFNKLFDKGYYQISAFMQNETQSAETLTALNEKGYSTLAMKDSLTDMTGGYDFVLQMITYGRLILEFIILFYIAYAVIRLIMRSRNSYYSTLRILGATKSNTDTILRVELLLMMLIAFGTDMAFVYLVKKDYLQIEPVKQLLYYLTTVDYCVLAALLLLMSLLIAGRYSRRIFTKSAMKAFREEA